MKFSEYPYSRPDRDALFLEFDSIFSAFEGAQSFAEQLTAMTEFDTVIKNYGTASTIAYIRHTVNTADAFYEAEQAFFDDTEPLIEEKNQQFKALLLGSKFRPETEKELGKLALINAQLEQKGFSPEIIPLMQEENALGSEYQKLYASARIELNGKTYTVAQLTPLKQSPDRELRKAAYTAEGRFFDDNREQFDELFDKLIKNRTAQANKLGFKTFTDLGYIRRMRNCYGKNEVKVFRDQVKADIVPIVKKIKEAQRKRIGVDKLRFYDDAFCFKEGNAKPHGTPDELLAAGRQMYTEMSPETAEFIEFMFDHDLFDVLAKEGKAPGGYCADIPNYKAPFIFSNFNGTAGDVDVLTHEAGHAFAARQAFKTIKWLTNCSGSMEVCETHSMAMEFLTMPWHHLFFKEDTDRYELYHMTDSINFLPYGCMVDNFQELCYENPNMTKQQRNDAWLALEGEYRPYIDFDNLPFYSRGGGYQRQMHIYLYPFYYVDYCMSGAVALQFFTLAQQNRAEAWEKYLALVNTAGLKTFVDVVKDAGLISPLAPGSLKEISKGLTKWLDEFKV